MPPVEIIELPKDAAATAKPEPEPEQQQRAKLYLAAPCFGCHMSLVFLTSVLNLQAVCIQNGVDCAVDFIGNESLVERARNILAARFLESDATHLLFIDSDIGFDPRSVLRLLQADKDVNTAVYPKKAFDWEQIKAKLASPEARTEPVHQMGLDFNINIASSSEPVKDGLVRVLDSATGFMLIKRHVLERMCEHYKEELYCVNDIIGQSIKEYVAIFACMIDPVTRRFLSEDFSFCRRWQQLGGEIWADVSIPLAHIGNGFFSGDLRDRLAGPPAAFGSPV